MREGMSWSCGGCSGCGSCGDGVDGAEKEEEEALLLLLSLLLWDFWVDLLGEGEERVAWSSSRLRFPTVLRSSDAMMWTLVVTPFLAR